MPADYRAMIIRGQRLASRCVSIAIGRLTPGFFGYWLDTRLGTEPVLLLIGFTAGFAYGLWRLTLLGKAASKLSGSPEPTTNNNPPAPSDASLADASNSSPPDPTDDAAGF